MSGPWEDYQPQQGPWSDYQPQQESLGSDLLKSAGSGLLQGGAMIAGLPNLAMRALGAGAQYLNPVKGAGVPDPRNMIGGMLDRANSALGPVKGQPLLPSADQFMAGLSPVGASYKPQTGLGQYAQTAASYIPAAFGGEGSLVGKITGRVLAPAAGSVAAQAVAPDDYKDIAGAVGAGAGSLPALAAAGFRAGAPALARGLAGSDAASPQAIEAISAGYRIPPTSASENPSAFSSIASAVGGKIKTSQAASEVNQDVTNRLAATDLGLGPTAELTPKTFKSIRSTAGKAYSAIADALPTVTADPRFSPGFADAAKNIGVVSPDVESVLPSIGDDSRIKSLQGDLSNFVQKPTQSVLNTVRQLRANATASMRSQDPATVAYGLAQRKAADALDGLIEDNLAASGQEDLAAKYRAARQLIAKSHDVELATNPATGDVNARVLGRLATKGKPLSGNLQTIANTSLAFPRATQMPSTFGGVEPLSVLDVGAGLINPKVGAMILSRPLARATVLSPSYQRAMIGSKLPIPPLNLPAPTPMRGLLGSAAP